MAKCCIFVNGNMKTQDFYKRQILEYELVISADGASNRLFEMKIIPDFIVGDLDSIKEKTLEFYKKQETTFIKFPSKKNKTDTEIAIDLAKEKGYIEITLFGFMGSRLDHMLGNIFMMYYADNKGLKLTLMDEDNVAYIINPGRFIIQGEKGRTVSFINFGIEARKISLEGFVYPLSNYDLELGSTRCISNILDSDEAVIELNEGKLIAILTNGEL